MLIVDILSWCISTGSNLKPKDSMNRSWYIASEVASDKATSSASVEDLVTILCFTDLHKIAPLPKVRKIPV